MDASSAPGVTGIDGSTSSLLLPLLEDDDEVVAEEIRNLGKGEAKCAPARLDFLHESGKVPRADLRRRAQWRKIWASYRHDRRKLRTLGVSMRTAIGCLLASCFVAVPSLYEQFPGGVQAMLCNSVVMVTFGVGDTLGETVCWCWSGTLGILVAYGNYRVMLSATSGLDSHHGSLRQALIVIEFWLYTVLVNASGTSYMARQMAMGYYAFYGLCLLNPGCNMGEGQAADLWTIVGALISILVMLWPPCPSAVRRVYSSAGGTLAGIAKAAARATTLTTSVFLAVEEHALAAAGGRAHPSAQSGHGGIAASSLVIQDCLDALSQLLAELEMDLSVFLWEGEVASTDMVRRFASMMRTAEGYLLMQRQGVLFNHSNDRGRGMDPDFLGALREDLSTMNVKVVRLLGLAVGLIQHRYAAGRCFVSFARSKLQPSEAMSEAKELREDLTKQVAHLRVYIARRNLASLQDFGTGRVMFVLSICRQCGEVAAFVGWLCGEIDEDAARRGELSGGFRRTAVDWMTSLFNFLRLCAVSSARRVLSLCDPRGKPWVYSFKAASALTSSFVMSAFCFNFDSMSVSATAYILGAQEQDARCLGGTIWKALCRVIGVMVGGILPAKIHNFFVPASGSEYDCGVAGHVANSLGSFLWVVLGIHLYKLNRMVTTEYGHFGYVGLVMAFIAAEQFLAGCQLRVPVSDFVLQTLGGSIVLLLIECAIRPIPACMSIQGRISGLLDRQVELLGGSTGGSLACSPEPGPAAAGSSLLLADAPSEQWTAEIQRLAAAVATVRSAANQAMTEDTFKVGHVFFLCMPRGYTTEPFRPELVSEVLTLVQQVHLNVLFLLFAREVDGMLSSEEAADLDADGEQPASADGLIVGFSDAGFHWHRALQKDMSRMIAILRDGLTDMKDLVEHSLLSGWQVRDLWIEATAGLLLQQAARSASGSGRMDRQNMRGIFQSVLEHVDPALSDEDIKMHWQAFEQVLQKQFEHEVSPDFFKEAISGVLQSLSGRPSLRLARLDALLRHESRLLRHGDVGGRLAGAVELPELGGDADAMDPATQRSATEICYQMALLDAALLLAFSAGQLCERLGHYTQSGEKELGGTEDAGACTSQ